MNKFALFIGCLGFIINSLQAQSYRINFKGTGVSTTIDSVKVENITQCKSMEFEGTDTLLLGPTEGINDLNAGDHESLSIYPNPIMFYSNIEFESLKSGNASIEIFDEMGRVIIKAQYEVQPGYNRFLVTGLGCGLYFIQVKSKSYSYNGKLLSNGIGKGSPEITFLNENKCLRNSLAVNRTTSIVQMQYNAGDMLKITGISGIYKTIVMLVPSSSQTVTFTFVACSDVDHNNYAVVQISTQTWMEENLKTTKYLDGSPIPNVSDSATWTNLTTGAYCNYHNDTLEGATYGHLYNYYAVGDARNLCPAGWHVASDSEWRVLENFLGDSVVAGQKMKENCSTRWEYNDTTWGTNTSGFTGLCANYRNSTGSWSMAPDNNHDSNFWSSTVDVTSFIWFRGLRWCYNDVFRAPALSTSGFSVRCVK